jgi:predicted dinucleotide-binding enzyme
MAKIAVLGTGDVGQRIGKKLIELGHEVRLGSRTADNEKGVAWAEEVGDKGEVATFADAVRFAGDTVFFCGSGANAMAMLESAGGAAAFDGKVIVDISNPLDFSGGFPPTLSVCNDNSLGEEIQKALPGAKVVKTLNMVANAIMVNPGALPEATDILLCGNDDGAKEKVTDVLRSFGWERITDMGDITNARALESWLLVWTRLYGKHQTGMFNIRLVFADA